MPPRTMAAIDTMRAATATTQMLLSRCAPTAAGQARMRTGRAPMRQLVEQHRQLLVEDLALPLSRRSSIPSGGLAGASVRRRSVRSLVVQQLIGKAPGGVDHLFGRGVGGVGGSSATEPAVRRCPPQGDLPSRQARAQHLEHPADGGELRGERRARFAISSPLISDRWRGVSLRARERGHHLRAGGRLLPDATR